MYTQDDQRSLYELSKKLLYTPQATLFEADEAERRAEDLSQVIRYHEWRYYVQNDPVVSDFEYDQLYKQLEALEKQYPELRGADSPTRRVGQDLTENFAQVDHLMPMLSLDNSYDAEDLSDFDESVKKLGKLDKETAVEYCVEPKFDGGTIVLLYENDRLVRAATRGNGYTGDEITANMRSLRSIPLQANFSKYGIQKVELRGEALIRKDIFEKMNRQRQEAGELLFANPRNAATGALRMKDPNETARRGLEAFVYQMGYAVDGQGNNVLDQFQSHDESIELLRSLGFKVPAQRPAPHQPLEETRTCANIAEVIDFCNAWQAHRDEYPYEVDGMVIKVNNIDLQIRCGSTSHHPR
ncbi:MAG: DNA ligase (NAD(+)) LigA, partial [Saprospiraceae bacterium]